MSAYHRCWTPVRCNRVPSNFGVTIFRVTRFRQTMFGVTMFRENIFWPTIFWVTIVRVTIVWIERALLELTPVIHPYIHQPIRWLKIEKSGLEVKKTRFGQKKLPIIFFLISLKIFLDLRSFANASTHFILAKYAISDRSYVSISWKWAKTSILG